MYFFCLRARVNAIRRRGEIWNYKAVKAFLWKDRSVDLSPGNLSRLSSQSREVRDYDTHYELKISTVWYGHKSDVRLHMPLWPYAFRFSGAHERDTRVLVFPHAQGGHPNVTVPSETAISFCACSRLILCFCMCVSVYTMASEELRLWRQSPAHIFAGLNLSGCTLYKHNKAPLHRGFCYTWLNVYVWITEYECKNIGVLSYIPGVSLKVSWWSALSEIGCLQGISCADKHPLIFLAMIMKVIFFK